MELNSLEREVMDMLLAGSDPILSILAQQLRAASVTNREMTGAGFFTAFQIPPTVPRLEGGKSLRIGDVVADIEGLEHGAGFVLFVDDGGIDFLEGYSYDEPWPENSEKFRLSYMGKPIRDLSRLWGGNYSEYGTEADRVLVNDLIVVDSRYYIVGFIIYRVS